MRMKSQGLRELFFGVAGGAARHLRVRSGGTAMAQRPEAMLLVYTAVLVALGRVVAQGDASTVGSRRVLRSGMISGGAGD